MREFLAGKYRLPLGERAYVMGILNVTPDSFSDGGRFLDPEKAVCHALEMREQGADLIDIGAQSTRPGHTQISPDEELARLLPVLKRLQGRLDIPVSVDTFYPAVALASLTYGVSVINDVTGFDDPGMIEVAARSDCGCIVMHHTGSPDSDILTGINLFFAHRIEKMGLAGIGSGRICLDPGIGFGKTHKENLTVLANSSRLETGGCALLVAASRKRVIGAECGNPPFDRRLAGTLAAHSIAIADGADIVRVHDVPEAVQAAKMAFAIRRYRIG
ncbi:MAG TPA: dihydropteroate synthase [Caproiciproducens sp.]|nr:dihydropteroate synthase [Caproiciproducens sp.]